MPDLLEIFTISPIPLGVDRRVPGAPRKPSYPLHSASLGRLLQSVLHVPHLSVVVYHDPLNGPLTIGTVSGPSRLKLNKKRFNSHLDSMGGKESTA